MEGNMLQSAKNKDSKGHWFSNEAWEEYERSSFICRNFYLFALVRGLKLHFMEVISQNSLDSGTLLRFVARSNLWISGGAFLLTYQAGFFYGLDKTSLFFISFLNFFCTFFIYNLQRVYLARTHTGFITQKDAWYLKYQGLLLALFVLFLPIAMYGFYYLFSWDLLECYAIMGLVSLLYFLPQVRLREIAYAKIFIIGAIWALACVWIPSRMAQITYSTTVLEYIFSQFLFIAAICIPFDIRDLRRDAVKKIITFPIRFGITNAKLLAIVMIGMSLYLLPLSVYAVFPLFFIHSLPVFLSHPKRKELFFSVGIDGLIYIQFIYLYFLYFFGFL